MKTEKTFPFPMGPKPDYIMRYDGPKSNLPIKTMHPYQKAALARAQIEAVTRKLTDENRAFLLQKAEILGVGIVHIFDESNPKGGMTVAFRKVSPFAKGTMVDVAVATCSKEDSFSRKTGTKLALESFFNGQTIALPISNPSSNEGISTQVKWAFEGLFYAI